MTGPRIALVGDPQWAGSHHARRALAVLAPDAEVRHLPAGAAPPTDLDGLWLLAPPAGVSPLVHDTTISWALQADLPLVGPIGTGAGGHPRGDAVASVPGSRLARALGEAPVPLPVLETTARPGGEYLTPAGTVWVAEAHRGQEPAAVSARGSTFVTLVDHPLATDAGLHPLLPALVDAARRHAAARHPAPRTASTSTLGSALAPLPDDEPRSYVHQMRTHGYRWWRPLLAALAGTGTFFFLAGALSVLWVLLDPSLFENASGSVDDMDLVAPVPMLIGNLILAALIPAVLVATRVGHWRPMGKIWSVTGRIRWGWLGLTALVTSLLWGGYLVAMLFLDGGGSGERPDHWQWLLVITLLTTPLQAAGEEVAFRGALLQGVGAWIKNPVIALVIGTVLSAALFALAHTSLDPWILLDLGAMAIACCYLTWRTGGLEAAIVLHVVNNLVLIVLLTLLGGLESAYVTEETTSTAGAAGVSALATLVMTAILLWLAQRVGIAPKERWTPATS